MNIFDYEGKEFDKKLDEIFKNINKENLKKELIECGLEIKKSGQMYKLKQESIIREQEYKPIQVPIITEQMHKLKQDPIITEQEYKLIQEYEQNTYLNMFDIHINNTSTTFVDKLLKRKKVKEEIGDVA